MTAKRGMARGGEETRRHILRVALELFAERGFAGTTVRLIAERCGISDAALYYHFRSKRAILESLFTSPSTASLQPPARGETLTEERLMQLVESQLDVTAEQDSFRRLLVREALAGDTLAAALRNEIVAIWRKFWLRHLRTRFNDEDSRRYCDAVLAVLQGSTLLGQIEYGAEYPEVLRRAEYRETIKALVRAAVPVGGDGKRAEAREGA